MPVDDPHWGPRQWMRVRLYSSAFLVFLAFPVVMLFADGLTPKEGWELAGIVAFATCFLRVVWRSVPVPYSNQTPYALVALLLIGAALIVPLGFGWLVAFAFYANAVLLVSLDRRWWLPTLGTVTGLYVVVGLVLNRNLGAVLGVAVQVVAIGGLQIAFSRQILDTVALRRARAELARLAVAEERLRISRDLHDVLGQRLAAVALKSELAVRLLRADPDRAEAEMTEVTKVAREALDDVRATVAGYRDVSLATEMHTAVALLTAASVEVTASGVPVALAPAVEEAAAWVVREAATNVVRHAHAQRCRIVVGRERGGVVVSVADDGVASGSVVSPGNGLSGLAERLSAVDGSLTVGPADGWFTVRAMIPT